MGCVRAFPCHRGRAVSTADLFIELGVPRRKNQTTGFSFWEKQETPVVGEVVL